MVSVFAYDKGNGYILKNTHTKEIIGVDKETLKELIKNGVSINGEVYPISNAKVGNNGRIYIRKAEIVRLNPYNLRKYYFNPNGNFFADLSGKNIEQEVLSGWSINDIHKIMSSGIKVYFVPIELNFVFDTMRIK